ncbi:hypothetical protein CBNA_0989 [Coxiella burnetii str. Namibia]|nr:hypothetical protein CBNA_0989 [Coxiella burnetii str. Namibia]
MQFIQKIVANKIAKVASSSAALCGVPVCTHG